MSNLYKQWGVAPKQEGARIINSNAIVAQKIEEMAKRCASRALEQKWILPMDSVRDLVQRTSKPFLRKPQADPIEEAKEEAERILSEAKKGGCNFK